MVSRGQETACSDRVKRMEFTVRARVPTIAGFGAKTLDKAMVFQVRLVALPEPASGGATQAAATACSDRVERTEFTVGARAPTTAGFGAKTLVRAMAFQVRLTALPEPASGAATQ